MKIPAKYRQFQDAIESRRCMLCGLHVPQGGEFQSPVLMLFTCKSHEQKIRDVWISYEVSKRGHRRKRSHVWWDLGLAEKPKWLQKKASSIPPLLVVR
jgi:hypothetical protein